VLFGQVYSEYNTLKNHQDEFKQEETIDRSAFIKILLIVLSFSKFGHFVSVYEGMGFFIMMMRQCMIGLIPFVMVFIILLNFFVVMYSVLDTEITGELLTPGAMETVGYYGMMNLAVLRNSVGKLNYPAYGGLVKKFE